MKFNSVLTALAAALAGTVLLASCGGGGGNPAGEEAATAAQVAGTAATGAALPNASVSVTDASGASPCVETSITTTALGSYTCTLQSGKSAPFFVVVTDPTGGTPALVSVTTTTPAAGQVLTLNATPLTTAIVAQLAGGDPMAVVNARSVDADALKAATANIVAQLASVLQAIGAPADYDPFSTSITAATADNTGNTADLVLDVVKVVTDPATGKLALTTIDNPTPVLLADANTGGSPVAAPDPAVSTLSQATQIAARAFSDCFALPVSQRVLHTTSRPQNQGGPEVDSVGAACEDLTASSGNAAGVEYLHNGYSAGQMFYSLLNRDAMTGASFSVPEIMAFYPKADGATAPAWEAYDRAVLNIRYLDAEGNPGNVITVAAKLPGTSSAARPTEWWLVGNQQPVDTSVNLIVRRVEQMNPANTSRFSTFQTGFLVSVNPKGPGSTSPDGDLAAARVSGPGLPGNGAAGTGLVFKPSASSALAAMDLFNKTGDLASGSLCGNNGVTANCPLIWVARTKGLTGADAATLATNPTNMLWAQPADAVDQTKFVKGARYKIELFYGDSTTPQLTVTKTLLSDLVPATTLVSLPWSAPGPKTLAALDPNGSLAGAQTALPLDWIQNPSAQQMVNVGAVIDSAGSYGPNQAIPPGVTSVVLNNSTVPAFGPTTSRSIKFNYRMTDTSTKSVVYQYN